MCRVLSYLGLPIPVEELLYAPDNSFIKQSYNPKYMPFLLNLAGFGMFAWDPKSHDPKLPFIYKTTRLPFYDENLRNLAQKVTPTCLLTHIRGVPYNKKQIVSNQNAHPFVYSGTDIAFAHNGSLSHFEEMKPELLKYIAPRYLIQIKGTTDSEWMYALFLSQLKDPKTQDRNEIVAAILKMFEIIKHIRTKNHIKGTSPINLFISNGKMLFATRYTLDFGWHANQKTTEHRAYHSLWYTYGERYGFFDNEYKMKDGESRLCIIIASEPLTEDTTTWIELPEYTLISAWHEEEQIKIASLDIVL